MIGDPSVDPLILAVMLVAFLAGAIGPFAMCVIGSIRDERRMRRLAAEAGPAAAGHPAGRPPLPPAAPLRQAEPAAVPDPANDADRPVRAVRS